ncbi:MAG: DUF2721 domain-containing protein [Bacteroidota bacterium]
MSFQGTEIGIPQVIQLMLAPGVMINACGLLLLGINNKYSTVTNRIRLLNEEKRRLSTRAGGKEFSVDESIRLESIARQISNLVPRLKLIRNAVMAYTCAIAIFVLTSLLIGMDFFMADADMRAPVITSFLIGMLTVITGVIFAFREIKKGHDIILFEIRADE